VNPVGPVTALVSNDGRYMATFDNWHSTGHGDKVVVIYRSDGTVVNNLGLDDFLTEEDIESLPRSVSSIQWSGKHRFDESQGLLVLKVSPDGKDTHDIGIELATGRPVAAKRDLFPHRHLRVSSGVYFEEVGGRSEYPWEEPVCVSSGVSFASKDLVPVQPERFYSMALERPLPAYPTMAKRTRFQTNFDVEVIVSETGTVECVQARGADSFGVAEAVVSSALQWRFEPLKVSGVPRKAIGRFAMHFELPEAGGSGGTS
jgi:hypothetical protein